MEMNEDQKMKDIKNAILSIVFLVWFFGSIVALVLTGKLGYIGWMIIVFGQYFIVFGGLALADQIKNGFKAPVLVMIPAVGLTTFVFGVIWQYGSAYVKGLVIGSVPNIAFILFAFCGCLLLLGFFVQRKMECGCTAVVVAECVKVDSRYARGRTRTYMVYSPTYKYYFGGREYEGSQQIYLEKGYPLVGESREIFVNPNNPSTFYEKGVTKIMQCATLIFGILFVFVSVISFCAYNFT